MNNYRCSGRNTLGLWCLWQSSPGPRSHCAHLHKCSPAHAAHKHTQNGREGLPLAQQWRSTETPELGETRAEDFWKRHKMWSPTSSHIRFLINIYHYHLPYKRKLCNILGNFLASTKIYKYIKINLEFFPSPGALLLYSKSSIPICDQQHNLNLSTVIKSCKHPQVVLS